MTSDHVCITNEDLSHLAAADRPRLCVRRGQHYAACEDESTCRGCVPRSATHGFLCMVCWEKLVDALNRAGGLIAHLRSIDTNGTNVGEKVDRSQERSILVPDSWLAADALMQALGARVIPSTANIDTAIRLARDAVAAWGDAEHVVNTVEGAEQAVVLIRRMQTALHRWPDAEAELRHIPDILCPQCHERALWRRAPLDYLDDLLVECGACDYKADYVEWVKTHAPVLQGELDEADRLAGKKLRPRPVHKIRASQSCAALDHDACRNLDCQCDCHVRTYSLWSPKHNINRIQEQMGQTA